MQRPCFSLGFSFWVSSRFFFTPFPMVFLWDTVFLLFCLLFLLGFLVIFYAWGILGGDSFLGFPEFFRFWRCCLG